MVEENKFIANGYEIPSEFIIQMDKQQFVRLGGLLHLANQMGMLKVITKDVSKPGTNEIVYEAEGRLIPNSQTLMKMGFDENTPQTLIDMFTIPTVAHGTCNTANTKPVMVRYMHVLAETRAVARCLRFLTGCALTAVEEMDSSDLAGRVIIQNDTVNATAADLLAIEAKTREEKITVIGRLMSKQPYKGIVDLYCKQNKAPLFTALNDDQITELYLQVSAKANEQ